MCGFLNQICDLGKQKLIIYISITYFEKKTCIVVIKIICEAGCVRLKLVFCCCS